MGPSLGFSAESHPWVLPGSCLGVAALRWSAEVLLLPVSCTKPSLPPEGAGVPVLCADPVVSIDRLHVAQA